MKNGQIFAANVCHFQYDHKVFFVKKWRTLERSKDLRLQRLAKFRLSG